MGSSYSKCCKYSEANQDLIAVKTISKTEEQLNSLLNSKRDTTRLDNDKPSLVDMAVFSNIEFINKVNQEKQGYSVSTDENSCLLAELFVPNNFIDDSSNEAELHESSYDRQNPSKIKQLQDQSLFFDKIIENSYIDNMFHDITIDQIEPFGDDCTIWSDIFDPIDAFGVKVEARDVVLSGEHLQEIQQWWEMKTSPLDYTYFYTITGKELQRRLDSSVNNYDLIYMTKKNQTTYFINRIELTSNSISKSKQVLL